MEGPVWLSVTLQAGALFHWFRSYSEREIIIVLRTGFIDLFVSPRNVALLLLSVTLSFWLPPTRPGGLLSVFHRFLSANVFEGLKTV